jgi:hypothetical protein
VFPELLAKKGHESNGIKGFRFRLSHAIPAYTEYRIENNRHILEFYIIDDGTHDHKNKNFVIHIDPNVQHPGGGGNGFP